MGKRFSTGERDTTKFDRDMERAFESRASVYRRHNRKAELEQEIAERRADLSSDDWFSLDC